MELADKILQDKLFLPRPMLSKLTQDLETPFFLYDGPGLANTIQNLQDVFAWCKDYTNYLPVAVNDNVNLLRWACQCGCGLYCTTHEELDIAFAAGCSGERILYGPLVPTEADLKRIVQCKGILVLDSMEAGNLAISMKQLPKRVLLAYNPMEKIEIQGRVLARPERVKQGMAFRDMMILAQKLASTKVEHLGIAGQMGQNVTYPGYYGAVLHHLNQAREQVEQVWGKPLFAFQLGDGMILDSNPQGQQPDLNMVGEWVEKVAQDEKIPPDIAIHTTMGKRLLGPHGILVTKAIFCKDRKKQILVVDLAVSRVPLIQQRTPRHVSVLESDDLVGRRNYDVVGLENTIAGRLGDNLYLSPVEVGSHCVIHDMGYHGGYGPQVYGQYLYQGTEELLPL